MLKKLKLKIMKRNCTLTNGCGLTQGTNFWSQRRNKIFTGVSPRPTATKGYLLDICLDITLDIVLDISRIQLMDKWFVSDLDIPGYWKDKSFGYHKDILSGYLMG